MKGAVYGHDTAETASLRRRKRVWNLATLLAAATGWIVGGRFGALTGAAAGAIAAVLMAYVILSLPLRLVIGGTTVRVYTELHTWEVGGIIWDSAAVVSFMLADKELRRQLAEAPAGGADQRADQRADALEGRGGASVASLLDLRDADVLDLGTGTGLVGLACAAAGARSVTMTDNLDSVLDLCERNRRANPRLRGRTRAVKHAWGEPVPPPHAPSSPPTRKKKTASRGGASQWDVELGGVGAEDITVSLDAAPLLPTPDGGEGGTRRGMYGLVLAIDCMHCAARTGGVERFPLAATLEEACSPDGACVLVYEPRGFAWDPVDEPFVARVEETFDVTHVPLRWLRADDESGAGKRWREWLAQAPHDWFHRGRADNWSSIRLVMLIPKNKGKGASVGGDASGPDGRRAPACE